MPAYSPANPKIAAAPSSNSLGAVIHHTHDGHANFWSWFQGSRAVDGLGRPLVLFHGTYPWETEDGRSLGNVFSFDRLASVNIVRRAHSIDTVGVWFSSNPGAGGAEMYGTTIYPVYLDIKTPHETTFSLLLRRARLLANGKDDGRMIGQAEVEALRRWLKAIGKDGIKIVHDPADRSSTEFVRQDAWIALEPEQIKSAIGNDGSFRPGCPLVTGRSQMELEPAPLKLAAPLAKAARNQVVAARGQVHSPGSAAPGPERVSERPTGFNDWFGDSKVVNELGEPLRVFHGTRSDVKSFSDEFIGDGHGASDWGEGFYFTNSIVAANHYAEGPSGNVMPVYLRLQNPADRSVMMSPRVQDAIDDGMGFESVSEVLAEMGYDGVIVDHDDGNKEYVVFEPSQIKSAISNSGAYSIDEPDITDGVDPLESMLLMSKGALPLQASHLGPNTTAAAQAGVAVSDLLQSQPFACWFDGSKAANPDGSPRLMFHGTRADIRTFSPDHFGRTDAGWAGAAFYFTPDPEEASVYASFVGPQMNPAAGISGANVMPVYLQIRNPLEWRLGTEESIRIQAQRNKLGPKGFVQWLRSRGHDGVHITSRQIGKAKPEDQWIVFEPGQIKSAISNTGRFAPECHDITDGVGLAPDHSQQENAEMIAQRSPPDSAQFRAWFGDSKVVDQRGLPKVLFHGASKAFKVFKPSKQGTFGPGIYFADTEESAQAYLHGDEGESVMQVYVSLRNPWVVNAQIDSPASINEDWDNPILEGVLALPKGRRLIDAARADVSLATYGHFGPALQRHLKDLGYDGIIGTYSDGSQEVVAFHPSQIKSATLNSGAYSPDCNDITDGAAAHKKPKLR